MTGILIIIGLILISLYFFWRQHKKDQKIISTFTDERDTSKNVTLYTTNKKDDYDGL